MASHPGIDKEANRRQRDLALGWVSAMKKSSTEDVEHPLPNFSGSRGRYKIARSTEDAGDCDARQDVRHQGKGILVGTRSSNSLGGLMNATISLPLGCLIDGPERP